jgi:hypothetical protein
MRRLNLHKMRIAILPALAIFAVMLFAPAQESIATVAQPTKTAIVATVDADSVNVTVAVALVEDQGVNPALVMSALKPNSTTGNLTVDNDRAGVFSDAVGENPGFNVSNQHTGKVGTANAEIVANITVDQTNGYTSGTAGGLPATNTTLTSAGNAVDIAFSGGDTAATAYLAAARVDAIATNTDGASLTLNTDTISTSATQLVTNTTVKQALASTHFGKTVVGADAATQLANYPNPFNSALVQNLDVFDDTGQTAMLTGAKTTAQVQNAAEDPVDLLGTNVATNTATPTTAGGLAAPNLFLSNGPAISFGVNFSANTVPA